MPYLTPNTPPANDFICRRLHIPNDETVIELVNGAISELVKPYLYEQFGAMTPEATSQMFAEMYLDYIESSVCMLGMIMPFATTNCPPNCLECDGAIYNRADYPRLWEVLDDSLKLNADEFRTPPLIGSFVLAGSGSFGEYPPFQEGGQAEVTLTAGQMPEHGHTAQPHSHTNAPHSHTTLPHSHGEVVAVPGIIPPGEIPVPVPVATAAPGVTSPAGVDVVSSGVVINGATVVIDAAGGGEAHNNMPPYYTLRYCMIAR